MTEKLANLHPLPAQADQDWLAVQTCAFFAPDGALALTNPHYRIRSGQQQMAQQVAQTIASGGALVAEAGTGVGKTFAYLVPALLGGQRTLISTATKNLQDQLFSRDLPYLCDLLGQALRLALLKGRGSYLCLHRLGLARQEVAVSQRSLHHTLARIERFAQHTRSGDLGELAGLDERSPAIALVTSTRDNCLGSQCPEFRRCHVNQARREALAADVVVINHHLFFADLAVRESGVAELLPSVQTVIFDEAHQLNETGVQFLGQQLGTGHVLDFCRDLLAAGLQLARGLADWQECCRTLELAARELRLGAGQWPAGSRLRWPHEAPEGLDAPSWRANLQALHAAFAPALEALDSVSEIAPDFVRLHQRAQTLQQRVAAFDQPGLPDGVRWLEIGTGLRLVQSPLDIAATVQQKLPGWTGAAAVESAPADDMHAPEPQETAENPAVPAAAPAKSWIFTSATLGDDARLRWFTEPCGLEQAAVLQVQSPFNYAAHAALYVPDMPLPGDARHATAVAALAALAAQRLGGRTLVLTTTLRNLHSIGEDLRAHLADDADAIEVLVQGESTKRHLTERFREGDANGSQPGCVLVASASFWEGIDVPGDALQLVVIDKLPFPPPNDPLVEARSQRLQRAGKSPFRDYSLPEAAVMLKQGAGRLIRSETDTGILVVCDNRLRHMSYGARLLRALPPMQRLSDEAAFMARLKALAAARNQPPSAPEQTPTRA